MVDAVRALSAIVRLVRFFAVVGLAGFGLFCLAGEGDAAAKPHRRHRKPVASAPADPQTPAEPPKPKIRRAWPLPALGGSESGAPEVLFTFDDGPGGEITESVLATLRKHSVQAIFFQVGERITGAGPRMKIHEIEDEILADGHVIGNHTVHHRDLCRKSNEPKIAAEIDENTRILSELVKMPILFFRAPYGVRCPALEEALTRSNLRHVHWDIDAEEWKSHDAVKTQTYIINHIEKLGDGQRAVVLIHDIHKETAAAMPVVLDWIAAENGRRRQSGRHEIKIIGPTDIAFARMAPGVPLALEQAATATLNFLPELQRSLALPFGSKFAKL